MSDDQGQKYRVSVQAALQITLTNTMRNAKRFAARAGVAESTLSEFLNNKRSINLSTFESLVFALKTDQYEYFLKILENGNAIIQDQVEGKSPLDSDDLDSLKRQAFFALVASYCYKCSRKDQLDLLTIIYLASCQNPLLRPEPDEQGRRK